jgi:hypothetical protein
MYREHTSLDFFDLVYPKLSQKGFFIDGKNEYLSLKKD